MIRLYYCSIEETLRQYVENTGLYGDVNHPRVLEKDKDAPPHRAAAITHWLEDQGIQLMQSSKNFGRATSEGPSDLK